MVQLVKSPSKGHEDGNGLYLEMKAIAGTMPHKKASFGSSKWCRTSLYELAIEAFLFNHDFMLINDVDSSFKI